MADITAAAADAAMAGGTPVGAWALVFAALGFFFGGYVKGAVGFALPLVAVTAAASFLPSQTAVAMLIAPVLVTNVWQALRQGVAPLIDTGRRFWAMNLTLGVVLWFSAGLLPGLDERTFFLIIGLLTGGFALVQLIGWRPRLSARFERPAGLAVGAVAGFFGGLAGIWGPPVVLYLTALSLPKRDQIRATGLAFLSGSLVLAPAHLATGVLNAQTGLLSLGALAPTALGMWLGQRMQDRLDQELFRKATLWVLAVAALNLLRRAAF